MFNALNQNFFNEWRITLEYAFFWIEVKEASSGMERCVCITKTTAVRTYQRACIEWTCKALVLKAISFFEVTKNTFRKGCLISTTNIICFISKHHLQRSIGPNHQEKNFSKEFIIIQIQLYWITIVIRFPFEVIVFVIQILQTFLSNLDFLCFFIQYKSEMIKIMFVLFKGDCYWIIFQIYPSSTQLKDTLGIIPEMFEFFSR